MQPQQRGPVWAWAWIALGVLIAALCISWLMLPVGDWAEAMRHWIIGLGAYGIAIYAGIFVIATLVLAPDWPLAVAAGMLYGLWAFPIVLAAAMVAASLAFLMARYLARRRVSAILAKTQKLAALDKAVSEGGWKIVILLRLSPIVPFNLQNYLFGITAIPFSHYLAATFAGIIPGAALFVYLGAVGTATVAPLEWATFGVGLLATAAVAVIVTRKAKAKLAEAGFGDRIR
jgi:uncharacterized membrane protein YdjX (TVP38/TMEM64 family)